MTMIRVSPLEVQVRCGWVDGCPRAIRLGREDLPVLTVARVRQESAAYPASSGPRTRFQVVTETATLDLVYRHRDRRWVVEGLDPAGVARLSARAAVSGTVDLRQRPLSDREPAWAPGEMRPEPSAAFVRAT